jgi:hypothetical protein
VRTVVLTEPTKGTKIYGSGLIYARIDAERMFTFHMEMT